jgi:NADH:ubiquinone oxidoreductase subunit B-like Fe-S oxidoreductase
MGDATANPIYVALFCVARCLIPVVILFGISYLLRRFGVVAKPTPPPEEYQSSEDNGY